MKSQTSRKIIVASVMAAVVGIGVATFALSSHPVASVAQTPHPPTPVTQIPAATLRAAETPAIPAPGAEIPDALAAIAQTPDAPAVVAHHDSRGTNSADTAAPPAVRRKLAPNQHLAKANTSAFAGDGAATRTGSTADRSEKPAAATVASSVDRAKSPDELTTTPASSSPTDDQKAGTSTEFAPSESQMPPK